MRRSFAAAPAPDGSEFDGEGGPVTSYEPKPGLRVTIDPRRCIANAKCTTAAPGFFVLDDETGVAILENEDAVSVEQLFAGARVCPTQAIIIEQFGRRVYPRILTPMFGERDDADEGAGGGTD